MDSYEIILLFLCLNIQRLCQDLELVNGCATGCRGVHGSIGVGFLFQLFHQTDGGAFYLVWARSSSNIISQIIIN